MLLAPHVAKLDLTDYVADNLTEVRNSLDEAPGAHDWSVYLQGMLEPGGISADTLWQTVRGKVVQLLQMDIRVPQSGSTILSHPITPPNALPKRRPNGSNASPPLPAWSRPAACSCSALPPLSGL